MTEDTSTPRRGLQRAAAKAASVPRHFQRAAAKAASFPLLGFQRAATKAASTPRHLQGAAAKVEQFVAWVSAISSHTSSPLPPYSPQVQEGHVNSYFGKCRRRRSYGSSNGPKRRHGDRHVRSYGDRIVHNNGGGRVYSYGTRRGYRKENRNVRSYGDRRVYSYGERQAFSYGDRYRRWCLYDRKRQPVVQSGHSESESGKWFRTRLTASDIKLTASRVGAFWVAGHFLTTFTRNLNFNNLPEILKVKYQWAGNEIKSLSQAQAVWESIPVQVRAGGPEALWKLHQGKQWSHIIPKSLGGPSTADNAIWWGSEKNRALGAKLMSQADIADAKAVLRSDAIRATFAQTATSMVRGAMVAVVVDGALACLECGLDYAEGKITWREMVQMVVRSGVIAGGGAFITTGLIVGISLLFPFLIPILTPVLFVLQATSLAFLGAKGVRLAKGWMAVLDRQQLLDHSAFGEAVKAFPRTVKALPSMASRNIYRSGSSLIGRALDLSARKAAQALPWKANVTAKELSV